MDHFRLDVFGVPAGGKAGESEGNNEGVSKARVHDRFPARFKTGPDTGKNTPGPALASLGSRSAEPGSSRYARQPIRAARSQLSIVVVVIVIIIVAAKAKVLARLHAPNSAPLGARLGDPQYVDGFPRPAIDLRRRIGVPGRGK